MEILVGATAVSFFTKLLYLIIELMVSNTVLFAIGLFAYALRVPLSVQLMHFFLLIFHKTKLQIIGIR